MSNYDKDIEDLKNAVSEINKKLTMQKGVKIDEPQDGNVGAANAEGEVDYAKFDNEARKKMVISKMMKDV